MSFIKRFKMKSALLGILACGLLACPAESPQSSTEGGGAASAAPQTEDEKTLYALGAMLAQSAVSHELSDAEASFVLAGVSDQLAGEESQVDLREFQPKVLAYLRQGAQRDAEAEKQASAAFVVEAAQREGATQTDSGLVYIETVAGTGANPAPEDTVRVHYHGTLRDGTVFDSSVDRGEPAQFPLNRVIPCWTEALGRMKVGGKSTIVCPSKIAYGDRGAPPHIKPGAALSFDVELLEIVNSEG